MSKFFALIQPQTRIWLIFKRSNFLRRLRAGADVEAFADYVARLSKELAPAAEEAELYFLEEWVESLYSQTKNDMVLIGLYRCKLPLFVSFP